MTQRIHHEFDRATTEAVRGLARKTRKTLAVDFDPSQTKAFGLYNLLLPQDEPVAAFESEEALRLYVIELASI